MLIVTLLSPGSNTAVPPLLCFATAGRREREGERERGREREREGERGREREGERE